MIDHRRLKHQPALNKKKSYRALDVAFVYVYHTEMNWKEIIRLLENCEQGLQKLVAEAVGAGDYPGVQRGTEFARAISGLAAEARTLDAPPRSAAPTNPAATTPGAAGRKSRPPADEYPKFFRRGEELVKIGWSRKEKAEYNHRAPRAAADATAMAVQRAGAKGKLFIGGDLFPVKDFATGSEIPDYQGYVALAWMAQLGIVKQHGRRSGYTLAPGEQVEELVGAAWAALPEWRG